MLDLLSLARGIDGQLPADPGEGENSPATGGAVLVLLSLDRGVDSQLLADSDEIGILDVVPLSNLLIGNRKALADAAQDITGSHGVDDVVAVIHIAAVCILPAAADLTQFFSLMISDIFVISFSFYQAFFLLTRIL